MPEIYPHLKTFSWNQFTVQLWSLLVKSYFDKIFQKNRGRVAKTWQRFFREIKFKESCKARFHDFFYVKTTSCKRLCCAQNIHTCDMWMYSPTNSSTLFVKLIKMLFVRDRISILEIRKDLRFGLLHSVLRDFSERNKYVGIR